MMDSLSSESGSGFAFNPGMLKEALRNQLPQEPFERLLRPIDLHVPLTEFQEWLDHLRWLRKFDWGEFTNAQLIVPTGIMQALKSRAGQGRVDKFSRTVALITMLITTSSTGHAWSEDITGTYLRRSDQNFVEAVVALLDALYQERAQKAPAGPVAFYWVAQAAALLPSIIAQSTGPTQVYFQWLVHHVGGRSRPPQEPKDPDRVLAYLLDRIGDRKGEVAYRQPRRLLSGRERVRLFFGENKNRWTMGAILRVGILVLSLLAVPFGALVWWKGQQNVQEAKKVNEARTASIEGSRKAFYALHAKDGTK